VYNMMGSDYTILVRLIRMLKSICINNVSIKLPRRPPEVPNQYILHKLNWLELGRSGWYEDK